MMTELYKFNLKRSDESDNFKSKYLYGWNKHSQPIVAHDSNGNTVVVCHGLSFFGLFTVLKTGITVKGLRKALSIPDSDKVFLICCYGGKLRNNDKDNTIIVNPENKPIRMKVQDYFGFVREGVFGIAGSEYTVLLNNE